MAPSAAASGESSLTRLEARPALTAAPPQEEAEVDGRFSLRELLFLVTLVAIGLSGMHWLPLRLYAGMSGLAALIGLVILSVLRPSRLVAHLAWWSVLGIYVLSAFAAVRSG